MAGLKIAAPFVFLAGLTAPCPTQAQMLLVGNKGEDTVSFVDFRTGNECARVPTGKAPHEIALSPDGRRAAVVAYGGTTVDIFDIASARLAKRIDIAPNDGPHGIAWVSANRIVLAADRSNSVVILDPRRGSFRSVVTGQKGSHMLVVSPDRRLAYTANILSGTISVIDLARGAKLRDIAIGGNPEGIAITRDGQQLWVGDNSGPRVRVVDLAGDRIVATLPTDSVAFRVGISPDGTRAVTSNLVSGTINLFDVATRQPLRSIRVSGSPAAMQVTLAFADEGRSVLVAETAHNTVAQVDLETGSLLRRFTAGKNGDGLAVSPLNCRSGVRANAGS
jgi:YVTN family beta-propeller protein